MQWQIELTEITMDFFEMFNYLLLLGVTHISYAHEDPHVIDYE